MFSFEQFCFSMVELNFLLTFLPLRKHFLQIFSQQKKSLQKRFFLRMPQCVCAVEKLKLDHR